MVPKKKACNLTDKHDAHRWGEGLYICEGWPTAERIHAARILLGLEKLPPLIGWGESG